MGIIDNEPEDAEPSNDEIDGVIKEYLEEPANSDKIVMHLYKRHGKKKIKKGYTKSSKRGKYDRGAKRKS